MEIQLTRFESTNDNLRTNEIRGKAQALPVVGRSFQMTAVSLKPGAFFRAISTSMVRKIKKIHDGKYEFWTQNSHYGLSIIN